MRFVFACFALCVVLLLNGCASLAQRVVLPGSFLKPPANVVPPSANYELVSLSTLGGDPLTAQFGAAFDKSGRLAESGAATVIFFYGNRMCMAGSQAIFEDLRRMGVNVLLPEYPGYGMNGGSPSELGCYRAADAAYRYLKRRADIDHSRIVIAGMSLGCGPAVDLASREPAAGLILVVPFTSIRDVGHDDLAWYLRWVVPLIAPYAAFDNRSKIPRVACPILLVQGAKDQLTSAKRSDELAAAVKSKLVRVTVDADHDGSWKKGCDPIEVWLQGIISGGK